MIDPIEHFSSEFTPTHEILNLISEIDEFKGQWTALKIFRPIVARIAALGNY
jgi:hypothetical protein